MGSNATVICTSALALVYSVAECCAPVWFRCSHCKDTELNQIMRILTGTVKTTQIQWQPVLANIASLDLRRLMHVEHTVNQIKIRP